MTAARTFVSQSGRQWRVELFELPPGIGVRTADGYILASAVLRFSSGEVTLDLAAYPSDWPDCSEETLVSLLRMAKVPAFVQVGTTPADIVQPTKDEVRDRRDAAEPGRETPPGS
jgi:hypothetical protein